MVDVTQIEDNDISVKETLDSRGKSYGNYGTQIMLRNNIMELIIKAYKSHNEYSAMPDKHKEYLWDIVNKLTRVAVTPNHVDTWHDIAGYALLIESDVRQDTIYNTEVNNADK